MFVGRHEELDQLRRALTSAAAGTGSVFLITGEAGIGKTRIADEVTRVAHDAGFRSGWARTWEAGGVPPFYLWRQVLDVLGLPAPDTREVTALENEHARFQMFGSVLQSLRAASQREPLLLVYDDLHAADPASLQLLQFVARELRGCRVVMIGTYRDVEAHLVTGIAEVLADIAREGRVLHIGPLRREDVTSFVRARAGERFDSELESSLWKTTQGNPLFLDEVLRLFHAQAVTTTGALPIPSTVRDSIQRRVARLPRDARQVFDCAIVLGRDLRLATLVAATGLTSERALECASEAVRHGLLSVTSDGWEVAHPLVREVAYSELASRERAQLHHAAAGALARTARSPEQIAHHYLAAGPDAIDAAIEWTVIASNQALAELAHENALFMLERAGEALAAAPQASERLRAELSVALGRARIRAGDVREGQAECSRAFDAAVQAGEAALAARAALGYGSQITISAVDSTLVCMLRDALGKLDEQDVGLRARVKARLAAALQPASDPAEPVALAREAIALARDLDGRSRLDVLVDALAAMMGYVDPAERIALNLEAAQLARSFGDRARELRSATRLVFDALELGDVRTADRQIEICERLARPPGAWMPSMIRAMRAVMAGRFREAEQRVAETIRIAGEDADTPELRRCLAIHRFGALRAEDRSAELLAHAPVLRSVLGPAEAHFLPAILGTLYACAGRTDDARAQLAGVASWELVVADANLAAMLVEPCVAAGDTERALLLEKVLRPHGTRFFGWGEWGMICEPPLTRQLGLLAGLLGRHVEAVAYLEDAVVRSEAVGADGYLPRLRRELDAAREALDAPDAHAATDRIPPPPSARDGTPVELIKTGDVWQVSHDGGRFLLKDSRGLQILARLVEQPGHAFHALELASTDPQRAAGLGDAGEFLDPRAITSYRERIGDLQAALQQAESRGDYHAAEKSREELEFLTSELASAVGLKNRRRRAGSSAERARSAVQRRIRDAIRKIAEHAPVLATHLDRAVRTGTFCSYQPDERRLPPR